MITAAGRGVPIALQNYISRLYTGTSTRLKVGSELSGVVHVRRGVRQGDPLSPLLFNYVMDWVLSELDTQLGVELQDSLKVNHLAFADDVSLLAQSRPCIAWYPDPRGKRKF